MTRRKMFLKMIVASLMRRRSRMLVALLSIAIGATILSGMVTIYYDIPRQMGAQFRNYGANMLVMPSGEEQMTTTTAQEALSIIPADDLVGASPYKYITVSMTSRQLSFVAAGTDFDQVQSTSPYFMVDGRYPENSREVLLGKELADTIGVKLNSVVELTYKPTVTEAAGETTEAELTAGATLNGSATGFGDNDITVTVTLDDDGNIATLTVDAATQTPEFGGRCEEEDFTSQFIGKRIPVSSDDFDGISGATITSNAVMTAINTSHASRAVADTTLKFTVVGLLDTGGEEEQYVYMSMSDLGALTGDSESLDLMELSVSGSSDELQTYVDAINNGSTGVTARLVKRVTNSEATVLTKLQALVLLVTVVVLVLTMISVMTTMMAVVAERRKEIGLRKALGASDQSIRAEFLGEGMFLGALGGLLGSFLGFGFAQLVSMQVFDSSITFQPLLLPITVIVSMLIAALSCLRPVKSAVAVDPAVVLKGE